MHLIYTVADRLCERVCISRESQLQPWKKTEYTTMFGFELRINIPRLLFLILINRIIIFILFLKYTNACRRNSLYAQVYILECGYAYRIYLIFACIMLYNSLSGTVQDCQKHYKRHFCFSFFLHCVELICGIHTLVDLVIQHCTLIFPRPEFTKSVKLFTEIHHVFLARKFNYNSSGLVCKKKKKSFKLCLYLEIKVQQTIQCIVKGADTND